MSPNKESKIIITCYAIVAGDFAMFTNPEFRGVNFKWAEFPKMMADKCKTEVFMYIIGTKSKKESDETSKVAAMHGEIIARRLVSRMGSLA
jgi:hypothetical protein